MKKRLFAIMMVVAMVFAMAACGSEPTASDSVAAELDTIKNTDSNEFIEEVISGAGIDKSSEALTGFLTKLQEFKYEIVDESVDGDSATVTVSITAYDFGAAFTNGYQDVLDKAMSGKLADKSAEEIEEMLYQPLADVSDFTYTKEVKVECKKNEDGEWVGDFESNMEFVDAIFGGLLTSMSGIAGA